MAPANASELSMSLMFLIGTERVGISTSVSPDASARLVNAGSVPKFSIMLFLRAGFELQLLVRSLP